MSKKDLLKQSPYFSELNETALDELSQLCKEETYKSGDTIFRENEVAKKFYIVVEGWVSLKIEEAGSTLTTIREKGELFGWASLVDPYRYTATALTLADTKVLSIEAEPFRNNFFQKHLKFALNFMNKLVKVINQRLEDSRKQLISCMRGAKPISQG